MPQLVPTTVAVEMFSFTTLSLERYLRKVQELRRVGFLPLDGPKH